MSLMEFGAERKYVLAVAHGIIRKFFFLYDVFACDADTMLELSVYCHADAPGTL